MDGGAIYVIASDNKLVELREKAYDSEAILQDLLAKYPHLLAGEQINTSEPRRWLLVAREAGLPAQEEGGARWSIDHLFLDQDGIPTIVEVKRSSDTRIRREVVGQMLDYAANAILYWPVETLKALFESQCEKTKVESDVALAQLLKENEVGSFWDKVKTNLQAGKVRLVLVADEIPTELRRIIDFLNVQMDPAEVLGVEVKQFAGKDLKTLVPRVVSKTIVKEEPGTGVVWHEDTFFSALAKKHGKTVAVTARSIFDWAQSKSLRFWWGRGKQYGSFYPMFDYKGESFWLFSVWTHGHIVIQFYNMIPRPAFDSVEKRTELLRRLNSIPGITLPDDSIGKYPSLSISSLNDPDKLKKFTDIFSWYIDEIKNFKAEEKGEVHGKTEE